MAGVQSTYLDNVQVSTAVAQSSSGATTEALPSPSPSSFSNFRETRPSFEPGHQANGWTIVTRLGGGFGDVYRVINNKTNEVAAMKAEIVKKIDESSLAKENRIYKALQKHSLGTRHIAAMLSFEKVNSPSNISSYLIMVLLGPNLKELKKRTGGKFGSSTVLRIGIQSLCGIKMLHDVGYVHRHLKPSSFMLGPPNSISKSRLIFLADFQIAKRFLKFAKNKVGIFREERDPEKIKLRGYVRYVSVGVQNGNEHRCRDDLWSWIYILAELLGCLPWQNVRVDPAKLLALKMTVSDSVLFSEVKNKEVKTHLVSIPEYVRTVHWESRPDYAGIYKRLKNAMNAIGCKFSDPYEWESNCDQISDGFMPEQEYLKYFNHEEMIIVRKGDAKFDNLESSAKDEDSPRIQRKVVCDCESDSLEVCSYVEPDATQYSESGKTPPQSSAPEKSKQEIEEKQKAKSKPNEKQEKSAQKLDPSPVTADSKKSFKVKTPTAASPAKKKEPEVLSDAKEDKKPTRNPPTKEESTKRKKRAIPTPPKKTPKKDESAKKGKKRAKNPDLTVDKTRDCTRDESIDKEETKSENDCSPAKNTPKTVTKKRVSKSTNAAQNIVQKKKNESREASPVAPTPTTKKEKKKKPSKK